MTPVGRTPQCLGNAIQRDFPAIFAWTAIALLAFGLRAAQMRESLWLDELHTAWTVAEGWSDVAWRAAIGNQSPLYFWIVALVRRGVGFHEIGLRLPSLLAGMALVLGAGWLTQRGTGCRSAGLLVGAMVALDRHAIFYAQEARPYALVQLVGLVHVGLFLVLLQRPSRRTRWAWIATGLGLYYLHYTAILVIPAQLVAWLLLHLRSAWRPRYGARQFIGDLGLLAVGLAPSIPQLLEIAQHRSAWGLFIPREIPLSAVLALFPLWVYLLIPLGFYGLAWMGSLWSGARSGESSAASAEVAGGARELAADASVPGYRERLSLLIVLVGWLGVPLLLAWLVTVLDWARLFFLRYVLVAAVAAPLLAGYFWSLIPSRRWRAVGAATLVAALIWQGGFVTQYLHDGRVLADRRQDWRGAVALLQQQVADRDGPVLVRSGLIEADRLRRPHHPRVRDYCLLPVRGLYRLEIPPDRLEPLPTSGSEQLTDQQWAAILGAGEAWFLLAGAAATVQRLQDRIVATLVEQGQRVHVERAFFGHVAVLHLQLASGDSAAEGAAFRRAPCGNGTRCVARDASTACGDQPFVAGAGA